MGGFLKLCLSIVFFQCLTVHCQNHLKGSIHDSVLTEGDDIDQRIENLIKQIRLEIAPSIKAVEEEIFHKNLKGMIVSIAFIVAAIFGMGKVAHDKRDFSKIPAGDKIHMLGYAMSGLGHGTFYTSKFTEPRVKCGLKDYNKVLKDFDFVFNPPPELNNVEVLFQTTKLNHKSKEKLFCLVSYSEELIEVKKLVSLIDLLTEIQQEKYAL